MQKITTFFMFKDRAGEAMDFYTSVFKNAKILGTMPGPDGTVMGGSFEIEGQRFNCYNGGPQFSFNWGISQMVNCETQEEIDYYYDKLSEGGEQQPCGWVTDKFGLSWQVTPTVLMQLISDPDRAKAERATQAMMKMHKLDIQALEDAAAGE